MLELYCELVLARSQLLDPPSSPYSSPAPQNAIPLDPALEEAVRSLIYAAPRTEVKELHAARALLVEKFGKEVALASMEGEGVAERVLNKLRVETPKQELVDAYLSEIARFYGVPFGVEETVTADGYEEDGGDDDDDEPNDGNKELAEPKRKQKPQRELEPPLEAETGLSKKSKEEEEREELVEATPPKKLGPQSPLRITPPSPSTDNVAPKLKLPGVPEELKARPGDMKRAPLKKKVDPPKDKIPDDDELAKRFAALKR
jgi:vacuolar protein sorting-associated protein IST1